MTTINPFRKDELKTAVSGAFYKSIKQLGVTTEAVEQAIAEVLSYKTIKTEEEKMVIVNHLNHLVTIQGK